MKRNEIDELVKQKLSNKKTTPPEHIWEQISTALDNDKKVVPFWNWKAVSGIAAGIALVSFISYSLLNKNNADVSTKNTKTEVVTNSSKNTETIVKEEENTSETIINNSTQNNASFNHITSNNKHQANKQSTSTDQNIFDKKPSKIEQHFQSPIITIETPIVVKKEEEKNPIGKEESFVKKEEINQKENSTKVIANNDLRNNYLDFSDYKGDIDELYNSGLEIGVSGGYNYGTLNTGVAMTVNLKKQLNSKLFIDGGVGLVLNNANDDIKQYNGNFLQAKGKSNTINTASRPLNQYSPANELYYLQLNPTLGYQMNKRLAFLVGPDYQQMMTNQSNVVMIKDNAKLLPKMDVGLTGGLELDVAPNLKANLKARGGINSFIRNNNDIVNRQYIQMSFKYQLPLD